MQPHKLVDEGDFIQLSDSELDELSEDDEISSSEESLDSIEWNIIQFYSFFNKK